MGPIPQQICKEEMGRSISERQIASDVTPEAVPKTLNHSTSEVAGHSLHKKQQLRHSRTCYIYTYCTCMLYTVT